MVTGRRQLPARALGWLFLAGATIGLVSLLLPHPARASLAGLYSNVGLAYVGGLVLLVGAGRIRPWMLQAAVVLGSLLITRAILLSGEPDSFYSVWYIWVGLYAFYFFSRAAAAGQVGLVALLYGLALASDPPSSPIARWLTTTATLVVAGLFIDTLVRRAHQQTSAAAASASGMARVAAVAHELAGLSDSTSSRLTLCAGAVRVTRADQGALWEPGPGRNGVRVTARAGLQAGDDTFPSSAPPGVVEALGSGRPVMSRDVSMGRPGRSDGTARAWVWQPVIREQRAVAVLELSWSDRETLNDPSTRALLDLLAVEVAVTLQRLALLAELEAKACTDELTGLPNRRWWHEQLPRELTRAARREESVTVAIIDLDHFKRYNDTFGHQSGDRLLRTVSGSWMSELRPSDMLARHGGEEFVLALPSCALSEGLEVVERMRGVVPDGQSCSAGLACWDGNETAAELLARADGALYSAKRNGRNQSALAPESSAGAMA